MQKSNFHVDYLGAKNEIVRVGFDDAANMQAALPELAPFFQDELQKGYTNWIFDFENLPFPTTSMIAFFVSVTEQARFAGGDVKIINASLSARNNFVTFSALTYLSLENNEKVALLALSGDHENEKTGSAPAVPLVDIAEPPVVNKFEKTDAFGQPLTNVSRSVEVQTEDEDFAYESESAGSAVAADFDRQVSYPAEKSRRKKTKEFGTRVDENRYHLRIESVAANLYKACEFVVAHAEKAGMEEKQIGKTRIAIYEACLNVIEHAYHSRPDNWLEIWVEYTSELFKVIIHDYGLSFEKKEPKKYNVQDAMEKRQTGGFGMHIIRRAMDLIDYVTDPVKGNELTLVKYLSS